MGIQSSEQLVKQQATPGGQSALNDALRVPGAVSRSILAADCGSIFTKVALLGVVEGQYRLLGRAEMPTTAYPPYRDSTVGVLQDSYELARITGRKVASRGQIITPERGDGDGVDAVAAAISA